MRWVQGALASIVITIALVVIGFALRWPLAMIALPLALGGCVTSAFALRGLWLKSAPKRDDR